jgi:hypothetical protein
MTYLLLGYAAAVLLIGGYCLHAWLDLRAAGGERLPEPGQEVGE